MYHVFTYPTHRGASTHQILTNLVQRRNSTTCKTINKTLLYKLTLINTCRVTYLNSAVVYGVDYKPV